jgi:hypothetical protein
VAQEARPARPHLPAEQPVRLPGHGKHAAYCAALRLGFDVPQTWLLPHKVPPDNERFAPTAARYNRAFDLKAVGAQVGYPMYMKPFHFRPDGGRVLRLGVQLL